MKQIYCMNAISKYGTDCLTEEYALTETMEEAHGILVRSASLHELETPDDLLAVARAGAGVNNIPLERFAKQGVVVFNTPGANANSVKELVIAAMILASRNVFAAEAWCKEIKDDPEITKTVEKGKKAFAGTEIKGKKLGVIGLGAIGAQVANAASALGMEVYGYDPYLSVQAAWTISRDVKHSTKLETLLAECDFITIHVPASKETKGMIGKDALTQMKDGTVVLNFARDVLVDEDAMADALDCGKVKAYITDFPNSQTVQMKGAIVIPHLGASTAEAEDNCAKMAVEELMDYLENGNIRNSVNYPSCDMGICKAACRLAILHKNVPNMIGQISAALANASINISDMVNKSQNQYAYTLMDLDRVPEAAVLKQMETIKEVLRVRVL